MSPKVVWLFVFVGLYWSYCIFWGIKGARMARTASDYFIAGRRLSLWVFVLAATATSFSGWTFMGHPGLVYRDGFQYAYASFYTITIPFTGTMFLKRQWMIGKRFGYVTPGEMFADYFQGEAIRFLTVIVALLYSIPYLGVQLGASGFLFNVLTDGLVGEQFGMWILSLVVLVYVASGGLRAVAYVDTAQCILLALGIVIVGIIALNAVGGWGALNDAMAALGKQPTLGKWKATPDGYNAYLAVPGVIQWTAGLGKETPVGGLWTGIMILTYMFALMGIQSAPAFSMWSFANTNPAPFAPQQVWGSAFMIGLILFFFTAFQGMAAHFLGAHPAVTEAGLAVGNVISDAVNKNPDSLVPYYFNLMADAAPWLIGFLAVCALAAMQSTGAAYMSTAGGILTRDLYKRYLNPTATHTTQKLFGRMGVAFIVISALLVATFSKDALVLLGGLAVAFGFQMWVPLVAICYVPWITRQGATWGLAVGLIAVIMTDSFGQTIGSMFGGLPFGRWPWTIHSAGWGILFNVIVCVVASMMTQNEHQLAHRMKFHSFLREHATLPANKKSLVPLAWGVTIAWFFFGIGPGCVIGNSIFGAPDAGRDGWTFGIPSIWAWQILFWILGVAMMWFLAYYMEMSTVPSKEVEALIEDVGDTSLEKPGV
ncbi:Sodium:solute symporter [Candidatus Defluviicoccus seviourii]|uniref:Sodium:solute symporter n=1 Tax=Candidatus Defluviicoccus seviourii TaxID=2565273 RepID=A0A564WA14_9PROT|nr:Sodium:solute symporter [Candidatus Defluviicoccus seviourii]